MLRALVNGRGQRGREALLRSMGGGVLLAGGLKRAAVVRGIIGPGPYRTPGGDKRMQSGAPEEAYKPAQVCFLG